MTEIETVAKDSETSRKKHVSAVKLYKQVPIIRRQEFVSQLLVAHVAALFIIGYVPILFPIGLITTLGTMFVCFLALTGPIYVKQLNYQTGELHTWGKWNKLAAVLVLLVCVGTYGLVGYWIFGQS